MDSVELTEEQFKLIKMFCENRALTVVCLHSIDSDNPKIQEQNKKNLENLLALERAGFVKNVNDMCREALDYAKRTGARTFDTFMITSEAYNMFTAPEGSVN